MRKKLDVLCLFESVKKRKIKRMREEKREIREREWGKGKLSTSCILKVTNDSM